MFPQSAYSGRGGGATFSPFLPPLSCLWLCLWRAVDFTGRVLQGGQKGYLEQLHGYHKVTRVATGETWAAVGQDGPLSVCGASRGRSAKGNKKQDPSTEPPCGDGGSCPGYIACTSGYWLKSPQLSWTGPFGLPFSSQATPSATVSASGAY